MKNSFVILFVLICRICYSQPDSIFDQGTYRTFIIHLPSGYNEDTAYPLVLNLHGLGSNAFEQQLYSQFDAIADDEGFIVVYADAINNSWDLLGDVDINFISHLVGTIRKRYSCNDCLFSTGMSMGGFLSYKLACELPEPISAIAVVTGNMIEPWLNTCAADDGMPVMHFHGTADGVVSYNGTFGIPPVEETVQWWADENGCDSTPEITSLPDTNPDDGCTAEEFQYSGCNNGSEVIFYKITNGGHTWPGAIHIPSLGNTNQDIDASALVGNFFKEHCNSSTEVKSVLAGKPVLIYPNPAQNSFTVEWPEGVFDISIHDLTGRKIFEEFENAGSVVIDCPGTMKGIYFVKFIMTGQIVAMQKIILLN